MTLYFRCRVIADRSRTTACGRAFAIAALMFAASCASTPSKAPPRALDSADSATAALYTRRCGACHAPFAPASHTDEEWAEIVPEMSKRAGLGAEESAAILRRQQTLN